MEYLLYLLTGLTAVLLVLVLLLLVRQNRTVRDWMTQWAAAPSGWPRCSPTTSG